METAQGKDLELSGEQPYKALAYPLTKALSFSSSQACGPRGPARLVVGPSGHRDLMADARVGALVVTLIIRGSNTLSIRYGSTGCEEGLSRLVPGPTLDADPSRTVAT